MACAFIIFTMHVPIVRNCCVSCIFAFNRLLSRWVDRFFFCSRPPACWVELSWIGNACEIAKTNNIKSRSNFMKTRHCSIYKHLYLLHKRDETRKIWLKANDGGGDCFITFSFLCPEEKKIHRNNNFPTKILPNRIVFLLADEKKIQFTLANGLNELSFHYSYIPDAILFVALNFRYFPHSFWTFLLYFYTQ